MGENDGIIMFCKVTRGKLSSGFESEWTYHTIKVLILGRIVRQHLFFRKGELVTSDQLSHTLTGFSRPFFLKQKKVE